MSAVDSLKQAPAADQRVYEPSMEEILASIRRIIADDQSLPHRAFLREEEDLRAALAASTPSGAIPTAAAAEEPVLPGRAIFAPPPPGAEPSAAARATQQNNDERRAGAPPRIAAVAPQGHIAAPQYAMPDMPSEIETPQGTAMDDGESTLTPGDETPSDPSQDALFSAATDQSLVVAFNTLAATRLVANNAELKDMTREMLRPLLKAWLDDKLPALVERLVRAEMDRVGRDR